MGASHSTNQHQHQIHKTGSRHNDVSRINTLTGNPIAAEISRGLAHKSEHEALNNTPGVRVRLAHVGLYCK